MKKIILSIVAVSAIMFASCKKDDIKKEDPKSAKTTYEFKDADGKSTVSHGGQTARLAMANEIKGDLGKATSTIASLEQKFTLGTGFSTEVQALNTSDKKIAKSVGVGSHNDLTTTEKEHYKALLAQTLVDFTSIVSTVDAIEGVAGSLKKGDKDIYLTAKGVEQNQLFAKTVIGSMCLDQVVNKYLAPEKLKPEDNKANETGKNYTAAQHHWDEAYGYVFGEITSSGKSGNAFLGKYLIKSVSKLKAFEGLDVKIRQAFIDGRQALVDKKYDVVKTKADFIKENLSKVVPIKAMHYLMSGVGKAKDGSTLHGLSEGLGFVHSLRFVRIKGKQLTEAQVTEVFTALGAANKDVNLWTVKDIDLKDAADKIAEITGISVASAE